ncbi:hypothetical protein ACYATM_06310 [Lactobacillaceae bacterium Scapto_B20]
MLLVTICSSIATFLVLLASSIAYRNKRLSTFSLISFIIYLGIIYGVTYFNGPTLALSTMLWANLIYAIGPTIIQLITIDIIFGEHHKHRRGEKRNQDDSKLKSWEKFFALVTWIVSTAIIILLVIGSISVITKSNVKKTYQSIQIENVKSDVAPTLKRGQTPVAITPKTVFNKVSKAMSDVPNSNAYEIAENDNGDKEIQAQYYHGKPVYVVPLQFRNFFKYQSTKTIPGYFMISATDPNGEPKFIQTKINYSDSSFFGHNIERNIYNHAPKYRQLSDNAQLEIDENGHPYYVSTLFKPRLFNNRIDYQRIKIAVEDAETGKVRLYDKGQTPKFIDENITSDVAAGMNHDFGYYVHGFWNSLSWGGQTDVKKPTENGPEDGVTTIFDGKGSIHYLSDFTSTSSSSNSALGYSMIDARTGLLKFYKTEGIMDTDGAIDNADRNYHAQNYHAEMPVLYSIDGHATWVMSVLDNSGLQRGFYYVDGSNPSIHADGSDVNTTLDAFRQALVNGGQKLSNSSAGKLSKKQGTVTRAFVTNKGTALFMINNDKTIYQVSTSDYQSVNLMRPGDKVQFTIGSDGTKSNATDFVDQTISK